MLGGAGRMITSDAGPDSTTHRPGVYVARHIEIDSITGPLLP